MSAPTTSPAELSVEPTRSKAGPVIEAVKASAYTVPTDTEEADGTLSWSSTTIIVVQVSSAGTVGTGWTYAPPSTAALVTDVLAPVLRGWFCLDVPGAWQAMVASVRNAGRPGQAGYAISAVDVALWDLKARLLDLPLRALLGAVRTSVPVYGSGGFTTYPDGRLTAQLTHWVDGQQIPRVKMKIGESWGTQTRRDLARMRLARRAVGDGVELFVDANGAYDRKQAVRVMADAQDLGVTWFEEPVSSDDLAGLRDVREAVTADVAAGEYGCDLFYFRRMCESGAVDCLQVDASRCGGISEWLRVAAVAAAHNLEVSGHCAPHLHVHAAAATPNLRHLEWFHDHVRVETLFFDGVLDPSGGSVRPDSTAAGHGLTLRSPEVDSYRVA